MIFPIYDITEYIWKKYREPNIIFKNPYSCIKVGKDYWRNIDKYRFVDCNGDIYKIIDFKFYKKTGICKYIPFIGNMYLYFAKTNEQYSFKEFQKLTIERAIESKNSTLEIVAKKATTFSEILLSNSKG